MKIIFLDIDGVLNSEEDLTNNVGLLWDVNDLNIKYIILLNEIIKATNAKVVISSTWRIIHPFDKIEKMMLKKGFVGEVISQTVLLSRTPDGVIQDRGDEINLWLKDNDIESFLILDDTPYEGIIKHFSNQFLYIKDSVGLHTEHVNEAISILNEDLS